MEPVRVKVYGLYSMTKRRYLTQAVLGVAFAAVIFVAWWFASPLVRERLSRTDVPPSIAAAAATYLAVLNAVPWILLGAVVFKAIEVFFVLRAFARKESVLTSPQRERGV